MRAIQLTNPGSPDILTDTTAAMPVPLDSQILVRNLWAGVNYIDTYQRSGRYPLDLPVTLGLEGAGVITEVGSEVLGFERGNRVAWAWAQGSYAEYVAVPADKATLIPEGIPDDVACAAMMQGITAQYLVTSVYPAKEGDTALVHAAAGGVGLLLTQMLAARGVTVIGTVSTEAKAAAALDAGATHVIRYNHEDFASRVQEITAGRKCDVVYDSVGVTTFEGSLTCLAPRATLALFGAASGPVPPFDLQRLSALGSIIVTRPTIAHFLQTAEENRWRSQEVFDAITAGTVHITVGGKYPLSNASQAHHDIESRATSGKLLLDVSA